MYYYSYVSHLNWIYILTFLIGGYCGNIITNKVCDFLEKKCQN